MGSSLPARGFIAAAVTLWLGALAGPAAGWGQDPAFPLVPQLDGRDGRELLLRNFRPQPTLRVHETRLTRAKFPVVDVHTHFRLRTRHSPEQLAQYVAVMDRQQIAVCVSLDGQLGDSFQEHLEYLAPHRNRFVVFATLDFQGTGRADEPASWDCHRDDFARRTIDALRAARQAGACGLKIFKQFGLEYRNPDGSLIRIDDPRFFPIWQACGELKLPVLIHAGDPIAFFQPIDELNERWEELSRHPEWSFPRDRFPTHAEILASLQRLIERHPGTTFIAAHLASNAEDLAAVGRWLDRHPNLYVEIASRIGELGRQPYTARKFFVQYSDRILFGTDGPWPEDRLRLYWRFLETFDEHFPYSEKEFPPQGFWRIYGLGLDEKTLRNVYYRNASRIIPGVTAKLASFPANTGSNVFSEDPGKDVAAPP